MPKHLDFLASSIGLDELWLGIPAKFIAFSALTTPVAEYLFGLDHAITVESAAVLMLSDLIIGFGKGVATGTLSTRFAYAELLRKVGTGISIAIGHIIDKVVADIGNHVPGLGANLFLLIFAVGAIYLEITSLMSNLLAIGSITPNTQGVVGKLVGGLLERVMDTREQSRTDGPTPSLILDPRAPLPATPIPGEGMTATPAIILTDTLPKEEPK